MKLFLVHFFLSVFVCAQISFEPLTSDEKFIIDQYSSSEMRVMRKTQHCDSILLKSISIPINPTEIHTQKLYEQMLKTVRHPDHAGVGIAAPQVGINRRLFLAQRFDKPEKPFELFINPVIKNHSEKFQLGPEGDLSFEERAHIYRYEWIEVEYQNLNGETIDERIEGFTAIIFQHERDHLDGILLVDRAEEQKKMKFISIGNNLFERVQE